jgi:hypothetical protein
VKADSLLASLGADPGFAEDVLGDLAEEYTLRAARDGALAARCWYLREALRSAPHLVRHAVRHLSPGGRARLAMSLATVVLALTVTLFALPGRLGPPHRLLAGMVVVNNLEPVRLPLRVLDKAGRSLPDTGVRYAWTSGAPLAVSAEGLVTCAKPADAVVRASLGTLVTQVPVRCRPVADIRAPGMLELILGAPAREVPFEAVGTDGRPVTLLVGRMNVGDTSVATLEGQRIRARAPGRTWVETFIGNRSTFSAVHVYGPAQSPEAVGPNQHLAVPLRLARGESRQWHLPAGRYLLRVVLDYDNQPTARLLVAGATCRLFERTHLECLSRSDLSVTVRPSPPAGRGPELRGTLLVWRQAR